MNISLIFICSRFLCSAVIFYNFPHKGLSLIAIPIGFCYCEWCLLILHFLISYFWVRIFLGFSDGSDGKKKNLPAMWRPGFDSWTGKIPSRRKWIPTPVLLPGEFHGQRYYWFLIINLYLAILLELNYFSNFVEALESLYRQSYEIYI